MSNNGNIFTTPSSSPAGTPMVSPRTYWSNEESQEINAEMAALPNMLRAANGPPRNNRSMEEALQAPIEENSASNQRAAIAANAAIQPAAANAMVEALVNEAAAPAVAAAAEPLDHPAALLMQSPRFIAKMFERIGFCAMYALSEHPNVQFNPSTITLIGGAALTIYEYLIEEYRTRKAGRLLRLREYIQDATRDMDIVWYMTNAPNQIQINPVLVRTLGTTIVYQLQTDYVKSIIIDLINTELHQEVAIEIETSDNAERYGTFAIRIKVTAQGYPPFTICDFSIHDGYSSQQFNDNHDPFPRDGRGQMIHRPVGTDPTYCDRFNILLFQVDGTYVCIPQLGRFVYQQLFAFGNLALHHDPSRWLSSMKNLKRILYLIRVFSVINPRNSQNSFNLGKLIVSRELTNQLFLNYLFYNLNNKINMILRKNVALKDAIIAVMQHFNFNNAPMEVLGRSSAPIRQTIERLQREHAQSSAAYMPMIHVPVPMLPQASAQASSQASPASMQLPPRPPRPPRNNGKPRNNGSRKGGKNKRKTRKRN
jgi:hypothetical protein